MMSNMQDSPYLSPPAEFLSYVDDITKLTSTSTIDPSKLYADVASYDHSSTNTERALSPSTAIASGSVAKSEADDDYGFSKFAAERDATRNEEDLDEDTRLLMSEEGRKLSSKERRQLRNKVSARNFRERRKEYITHLESLVSKHQNEAQTYKVQVDTLKGEKDELANELSRLKISISAALESNKLAQQQTLCGAANTTRTLSRSSTPTREMNLIPSMTKDVNPYSANSMFNVDWPLSNMASPSSGTFDFNLHNYTSVFSAHPLPNDPTFSEKELLGKGMAQSTTPSECLEVFDRVLSSILGDNWSSSLQLPLDDSSA
ncbi:protein of unknown function [Taphrina deformans PYCC 5710]|uniref:BZIP domain-containing protein n=1 Tax=Taphrina deformans (strain PYCC 5710 / ATCC 11124 / CBS 356.35 / IMI 108563 / JCM 9778 / NBRC 8474) TaxID=1097556 RepID=R4XD10_TAPDE|nr:protein of unknown function [Taphrina deformans PYCC 5710]|eukprot:CCG83699.1 protein of unknown function [Taphrina deformans PYCC 5710]